MSCSIRARVSGAVCFQVPKEDSAAATAALTLAADALGHEPITSLVAGSRTSIRSLVSTRAGPILRSSWNSDVGGRAATE